MAIKLKAKEQLQYVGKYAGQYRFVMTTELYNKLTERKVLAEAAMRSGISQGTINAAWAAIGEVIKAWATEGHSVAVPGLGTMRFGVRATSVADVSDVSSSLITSRRVIFTPSTAESGRNSKVVLRLSPIWSGCLPAWAMSSCM